MKIKKRSVEQARKIHLEAKEKLLKQIQKNFAPDEEPTQIFQTINPDEEPTEEILIPQPQEESLHEQIYNLDQELNLNPQQQIILKRKLKQLAHKVKELQEQHDLNYNNILALARSLIK